MNVSKKSWHYKLNLLFDDSEDWMVRYRRYNLCKYFWTTVSRLALFALLGGFIALVIFGSISIALEPGGVFLLTGFVTLLASIPISFVAVSKFRSLGWTNDPQSFNLVKEYMKAKKSKLCPMIEFVD